ncbi:hypothetical protein N782_17585 [Pontibacillus yanchengensis Y32]|uniref:DUF58 domain-containing protein n=1 Tax=Pontibacillus yanchengensis Y32 TaxID=1385514 RepID=A0A0A2TXY4_9BACI|nr:hypothetical protein N782_17585 [Pontibacillus yanchengensis Y32]
MAILLSFSDFLFMPKKKDLTLERTMKEEIERNAEYEVKISIQNASPYQATFDLMDGLPITFTRNFPVKGTIPGQAKLHVKYKTKAPFRGDYQIQKVYVRYRSKIGLWKRQVSPNVHTDIRVLPDMTETRHFLENAQQFLLYEGQTIKKRQLGTGEFAKIRKYVVGDDLRKINWRQTAKLQELMTNEHEPEHGKYISILIDCGRMMGVELEHHNRLERSLEAALTVAAAALQKGDYVSVLAFSKDVKAYVPPNKGMKHLQTIIHELYNIEVDPYESNYASVLQYLQTVQKKRSFILLFSDVSTFLYEEAHLFYLQRVRRKHVFMMLGVENQMTDAWTREVPTDQQTAMVKSMAQRHVLEKKKELAKWEKQGLQLIETPEERLATSAVSHYIDIMNRGLL